MKLFNTLSYFLLFSFIVSCGYFSDTPVDESETFRPQKLSGECVFDVDELSQLLSKDVQNQIDCLENNLLDFTKYVRRGNRSSVEGGELAGFIRRFFKGHASVIVESMGLLFDINALFLRDESVSISTKNIKPLFNLLRVANKRISQFNETVKKFDEGEIHINSAQLLIEKNIKLFSEEVKSIIIQNGVANDSSINLRNFFTKISERFLTITLDKESINTVLGIKKLYLGGQREILTRQQLFLFLEKLPELAGVGFSFLYATEKNQNGGVNLYKKYKRNIEILNKYVFSHRREEVIFKEGEIASLVAKYFPERSEFYLEVLGEIKTNLLGANSKNSSFTYQEIRNMSFLSGIIVEGLIFNESYKDSIEGVSNSILLHWKWKKKQFIEHFRNFKKFMITSLNENMYFPQKTKILSFGEYLSENFESFPINKFQMSFASLAKVALVGGRKDFFTKLELLILLEKSDKLADIFFEILNSSDKTHNEQEKIRSYFLSIKKLRTLISPQQYLHVTSMKFLLEKSAEFFKNEGIKNYISTAEDLKVKILGGYNNFLTISDISKMLALAEDYFGKSYFLNLSYDLHKDVLKEPGAINFVNYKHHKEFKNYSKEQILDHHDLFTELVAKFRIYTNEDGTQYYGDDYRRTKHGLLFNFMIKYAADLLLKAYGSKPQNSDKYAVNIPQLNTILWLFRPVLEDFNMWSNKTENFARNVVLLSDLFQWQSNGNMLMDPLELAEYGTLALFAINAGGELEKEIRKNCNQITLNGVKGYRLSCYRKDFFDAFLNRMNMKERLPRLNDYITNSPKNEIFDFLKSVEGFAREVNDEARPMTTKDLILLLGAILNIESTYLRYDVDKNNFIDSVELLNAFPTYEDAIMLMANLDESKRGYAKSIFLYMIKYMKKPGKIEFSLFHFNPIRSNNISSKRLNIGALLYKMVIED